MTASFGMTASLGMINWVVSKRGILLLVRRWVAVGVGVVILGKDREGEGSSEGET
jgi:hypothetical protein